MDRLNLSISNFCGPDARLRDGVCGYGSCREDYTGCVCDSGYVYDTSNGLYPNCFLPENGNLIFYILFSISAVVVGTWCFIESRHSAQLPRRLLRWSSLGAFLMPFYALSHSFEGYHGIATSLLLWAIMTVDVSICTSLIMHSFLRPLFKAAGMNTYNLRVSLYGNGLLFSVGVFIAWIGAYTNSKNTTAYNNWTTGYFIVVMLSSVTCSVIIYAASKRLTNSLESTAKNKQVKMNEESNIRLMRYIKRAKFIRRFMLTLCALSILFSFPPVVFQLRFGVFPYRFIVWWLTCFSLLAFNAGCIVYAKSRSYLSLDANGKPQTLIRRTLRAATGLSRRRLVYTDDDDDEEQLDVNVEAGDLTAAVELSEETSEAGSSGVVVIANSNDEEARSHDKASTQPEPNERDDDAHQGKDQYPCQSENDNNHSRSQENLKLTVRFEA